MRYLLSLLLLVSLVFQSCEEKKPQGKIVLNRANLDSLLKIYPDSISLLLKRGDLLFEELLY